MRKTNDTSLIRRPGGGSRGGTDGKWRLSESDLQSPTGWSDMIHYAQAHLHLGRALDAKRTRKRNSSGPTKGNHRHHFIGSLQAPTKR
jgi:hypothetical protein